MQQSKVLVVLLAVLLLSIVILSVNLIQLTGNIYYVSDEAVEDLCRVLEEAGIQLNPALVPQRREDGVIYVSDGTDYASQAAVLVSGSEIKSTYAIPDGSLFLHYNDDIMACTDDFRFHYRKEGREASLQWDGDDMITGSTPLSPDKEKAAVEAAMAFLDRQAAGGGTDETMRLSIRTVIDSVWSGEDNSRYVRCLRQVDGVEITGNEVICRVEDGMVTEAVGKWCFITSGMSYTAQLSDITNILFTIKRTLQDGAEDAQVCTIQALESCYSLYFLSEGNGFCLIPCWRVTTDTEGILILNALDGTLYTKLQEIP